MSNVHEPYFASFNRPIHEIGISADRKAANLSPARRVTDVRVVADRVDGPLDRELHIARAARTSFVEIGEDFREIDFGITVTRHYGDTPGIGLRPYVETRLIE